MAVVEARPPTPAGQVYQLKVTLLEVVPRIWRRFQVTGDMKLSALHRTLQAVMGWENSHLHPFLEFQVVIESSFLSSQASPGAPVNSR